MKKIFIKLSIAASILFTLSACTDIIELDLENVEPRIIIEATLNASDSTCVVHATFSNNFYDTTQNSTVNDLSVILYGPQDQIYNLTQDITGNYTTYNVVANQGDEFLLKITDKDGNEYSANAVTPGNPGPFLTLFTNFEGGPPPVVDSAGNERKRLFGINYWLDIPNEVNYYRFKIYYNGDYLNDSYNFVDDQSSFSDTMQMGLSELFIEFDTVRVDLITINQATYDFYQQLMDIQFSGINSTTPYNPIGNFTNEAIGYFCIQTVVSEEFIVFEFPF
ncbi:MAG: DUF4249 domain-containing protein [Bacteroidales bacterium]|nr:DUF4249 domain-containing protein [Bacteroidales bacterium]